MRPLPVFALGALFGATALWLSLPRLESLDLAGYANRVLWLSMVDERRPRERTAVAAERQRALGSPSSAHFDERLPPADRQMELRPPEPAVSAPAAAQSEPELTKAPESMPAVTLTPSQLLGMPIAGLDASQLRDDFADPRGEGRGHEAIDIAAPLGTPVLAVDDGRVVKLFTSERGGLTVYQFDSQDQVAYYYAHLDHYAAGLAEGQPIHRGDLIGYVGYTGNANILAPHLHFAIFALGPEKQWWKGTPINPYPRLGGQ